MFLEQEILTFNTNEYLSEFRNRIIEYLFLIDKIHQCKQRLKTGVEEDNISEITLKLKQNIDYSKKLKIYLKTNVKNVINLIDLLDRIDYKTIIKYRYISGWKWTKIIDLRFGDKSDFEYDPEKYKFKILAQHKQALKALQKAVYQNDDRNAYKFISNTIFDNKKVSKIFNEKYQNTYIHNYLLKIHNKREKINGKY